MKKVLTTQPTEATSSDRADAAAAGDGLTWPSDPRAGLSRELEGIASTVQRAREALRPVRIYRPRLAATTIFPRHALFIHTYRHDDCGCGDPVQVFKAAAAAVTLGTGASLGPEGPSVEIGTAAAGVLGGVLRSKRKHYVSLIAAGSGAGVRAEKTPAVWWRSSLCGFSIPSLTFVRSFWIMSFVSPLSV